MSDKPSSRHGLTALKSRVALRGFKAIDGRTAAAQSLIAWKRELLSDLGGAEHISAQKAALIDLAVRTRLFIDHIDSYLLEQRSVINRKKKSILPVLRERTQLAESLMRYLQALGLDRVEVDGGALPAEWIEKLKPHSEDEPTAAADSEDSTRGADANDQSHS